VAAESILDRVERYYSGRFAEHGATARGVDWNSAASQELRFRQLLRLVEDEPGRFSLNDYGCGYGALAPYLIRRNANVVYRGFDLSASMLEHARETYERPPDVVFVAHESNLGPADYTVASGIFNVKLDVPEAEWRVYVLETIDKLAQLSARGFAFNMLTSYAEPEKMRPDLYYGDPCELFDQCIVRFTRHVALLQDYGLWEFTMIVRMQ
jgi:SAM-dependent methyltransferase